MGYSLSLKQRWMPLLCIRQRADEISYQKLTQHGWETVAPHALPESTPFSYQVALIADSACSFRSRKYPTDLVEANVLDEAILLDLEQWSPFVDGYKYLSFVERQGDCWQVAVWVWAESVSEQLLSQLPENIQCTHLLPEMAWQAACVRDSVPSLLLHSGDGGQYLAHLSDLGIPDVIASPNNKDEIQRFLRGLGARYGKVEKLWLSPESKKEIWQPEDFPQHTIKADYPRLPLLNRSRLDGVQDWTDPMTWRTFIIATSFLFVFWMAADSLQLMQRAGDMDDALSHAQKASQTVLQHRNKVEDLRDRLVAFSSLRHSQYAPEKLLLELSQKIPNDIWLNTIRMNDNRVDITGQGKDVARLIVLMESMKGIKHAAFLSELRPYLSAGKGLEAFQLRLILQMQDGLI